MPTSAAWLIPEPAPTAGLHEALRMLATACLLLRALAPLRAAADAAVVEGIVRRADSVLAYLEPPRHWALAAGDVRPTAFCAVVRNLPGRCGAAVTGAGRN